MKRLIISMIAALSSKTSAIGNGNELLFHIKDDLKRFRSLTSGHPVIMGRKTFESIGRPLPDRLNIVITRNPEFKAEGVITAFSLNDAIEKAAQAPRLNLKSEKRFNLEKIIQENEINQPDYPRSSASSEVFIIGGGEIYKQAMPLADKLYLTIVESDLDGDVHFPDWQNEFSKEVFREKRTDSETGLSYAWVDFER